MSTALRASADPPYTGPLGATRREFVFVPHAPGGHRRVEVVRALNAVTDAGLARQALDGSLHRVGDHDLAVPFVYHDPAQRRFYLVVPVARAHEELTLRAELLTRLAGETQEPLPGYVREARTVVGPAGLRKALDAPAPGAVDARAADLARREQELSAREQELGRREAALRDREAELEARIADHAMREQDLEMRMSELLSREELLSEEKELVRANTAALSARERSIVARESSAAAPSEELADDSLELEPEEPTGQHRAAAAAAPPPPPAAAPDEADGEALDAEPEPDELAPEEVAAVDEAPVPQWIQNGAAPLAAVVEGEVRLWCQGTADTARALSGAVTPTLQVDPAGHLPLALLTVRGERSAVTSVALDLTRPDDRAVLESLARDFRVRVELVSETGRALGSHPCAAASEAIAQRALEVLGRRDAGTADARAAEAAKLVAEGVRWSEVDVSAVSFDAEAVLAAADGVATALAAYEPLLSRLRADRFSLAMGIAPSAIEATGRRLVLAALRCGVLLSPAFVQHAVTHGVAADEKALATKALATYARSLEGGPASIGRDAAGASEAWGPLLAWAQKLDIAIPDAARDAIAAVYDPDDPDATPVPDTRAAPDDDALRAMDDRALAAWLNHPEAVARVAREFVRRDPTKHQVELRRALRILPARELARLAPSLLEAGDALADLWVELLSSKRPRLADVAAAAAGALKLRRALTPLVQRTMAPESETWRLSGWAAGELGGAVVRAVTRLDAPAAERVAWVLAHAIRNGAAKDVERARAGANAAFLEAATRALGMQDEARAYDEALRRGEAGSTHERSLAPVFAPAAA